MKRRNFSNRNSRIALVRLEDSAKLRKFATIDEVSFSLPERKLERNKTSLTKSQLVVFHHSLSIASWRRLVAMSLCMAIHRLASFASSNTEIAYRIDQTQH